MSSPLTAAGTLASWLLVISCFAAGSSASAQQAADEAARAQARELGAAGIDDYEAGRLVEADKKLERAYELLAAPTIGLWSARARVQLGRWVEASERYRAASVLSTAVGDSETQTEARRDAEQELSALLQRMPRLTIKLEDAAATNVKVELNGVELAASRLGAAILVNPGTHKIVATRASERTEAVVQLAEKEHKAVSVRFEAAAAPFVAPDVVARTADPLAPVEGVESLRAPVKSLGIIGLSIGALGLAISVGSAIVASNKLKVCSEEGGKHFCDTQSQLDAYNTAKTVSKVAFWAGSAVALAGGITLLVNARGAQTSEQTLSLSVSPNSVQVHGAF